MSLAAAEKTGRSRCDSPAPRAAAAASQYEPVCKESKETSAPPLSVAVFLVTALLLGRAAFLNDAQESLGDGSTWTALTAFLVTGVIVMRFDIHDIAREEARKESGKQTPFNPHAAKSAWPWLILTSLAVLLLAVAATCCAEATAGRRPYMAAPLRVPSDSLKSSTAVIFMSEELHIRSTKLKGAPEDIENVFGRYFDASLVRGPDFTTRLPEAAHSRAREEAAATIATLRAKCLKATTPHRWHASVNLPDELAIFFLSAALAIGLATSRSDVSEISQEDQDRITTGSEVEMPSAEKFFKPSQARSQWRLFACVALLLALVASMVASLVEDI
jgi:hypothetical protein